MILALTLGGVGFLSMLVAAAGLQREPVGRILVGLFWFGLGAANGTGAAVALRMDRLWLKGRRVVERCVEPGKYWTLVLTLASCGTIGVGWGVGIWLGWLPWR